MSKPNQNKIGPVAVLDLLPIATQDKVRCIAPDLDLRFIASSSPADIAATMQGAPYVVARNIALPAQILTDNNSVRLIHQWGTGIDGIPVETARQMGVQVARSPGRNAPTVADLTIGLMLAALRRIPQMHNATCAGNWAPGNLISGARDLTGRTVGLIGFGAIGQQVARRLSGFDCDVLYYTRSGAIETADARYADINEILSTADLVSLHLPLTNSTQHILGAEQLAQMKPGATLINTSRGGLVDEPALIAALQNGLISSAGLDVFAQEPVNPDNPLLTLDNVVALPHIGGRTDDNLERMVRHWAGNIKAFHEGRDIDDNCIVC